jgi:hypothetical protein
VLTATSADTLSAVCMPLLVCAIERGEVSITAFVPTEHDERFCVGVTAVAAAMRAGWTPVGVDLATTDDAACVSDAMAG